MIDIKAKIHDSFSIEFKVGFVVRRKLKENHFAINTWIFIPNSLDISPLTYTKTDFYNDVKSNIRFITPRFLLREIAGGNAIPLGNLRRSMESVATDPTRSAIHEYEYQIKMFSAIYKSALRDEIIHIVNNPIRSDIEYLLRSYIDNNSAITAQYRELRRIINVPSITPNVLNYYLFGDEFISNILEQNCFRLLDQLRARVPDLDNEFVNGIKNIIHSEHDYKAGTGYMIVQKDNPANNRDLIFRHGILKKYVESDLFLKARRKKDGIVIEQIYMSIAAGLAMIFATAVAFWGQRTYGGRITMPLFVALVVSYMLKDRIKELSRFYFAHKLGPKYFDTKTSISIKDTLIGWSKEAVDFITDPKVPREVLELRNRSSLLEAENRTMDEKILLYRKLVHIDREIMEANSEYSISGINDIMRLHFNRFMAKTDNPQVPLHVINDDDTISIVNGEKAYYINIIMQMQFEDQINYRRFRVVFNRLGITEIQEV